MTLPMAALVPNEPISGDEERVAHGLLHCHQQLNTLAQQLFAATAQIQAVTSVLHAHGLISDDELAEQREAAEKQLREVFQQRQVGVQIDENLHDKYSIPPEDLPVIDCEARYPLCHAACCSLRFALSRQDLAEGIMRWEYGDPYLNRHGPDDRCVHLDRGTYHCTIYQNRPRICRTYNCSKDSRIWADFENRVINPDLFVIGEDGQRRIQFPDTRERPLSGGEPMEQSVLSSAEGPC